MGNVLQEIYDELLSSLDCRCEGGKVPSAASVKKARFDKIISDTTPIEGDSKIAKEWKIHERGVKLARANLLNYEPGELDPSELFSPCTLCQGTGKIRKILGEGDLQRLLLRVVRHLKDTQ